MHTRESSGSIEGERESEGEREREREGERERERGREREREQGNRKDSHDTPMTSEANRPGWVSSP